MDEESEGIMNLGDRIGLSLRTIRTRGVVLSEDEMRRYRIRCVHNSVGDVDVMTDSHIGSFVRKSYDPGRGEVAVVETKSYHHNIITGRVPLMVVSVIIFEDIFSWHMYALHNLDIYHRIGKRNSLLTLLN